MPRNEYTSTKLAVVLTDIQNGASSHSKCLDRLIELHFHDSERFKRDFAGHLNRILVVAGDKRDINIEKLVNLVIDFVAGKIGTEEDNQYKRCQFCLFAIQHLLDRTHVKDKSIRYSHLSSLLLSSLLSYLSSPISPLPSLLSPPPLLPSSPLLSYLSSPTISPHSINFL
jgi:hypothetical protein